MATHTEAGAGLKQTNPRSQLTSISSINSKHLAKLHLSSPFLLSNLHTMVFAQTMSRTSAPQAAQRLGMTSHIGNAASLLPVRAPMRLARVARTAVIPQARGKLDPVRCSARPDAASVS